MQAGYLTICAIQPQRSAETNSEESASPTTRSMVAHVPVCLTPMHRPRKTLPPTHLGLTQAVYCLAPILPACNQTGHPTLTHLHNVTATNPRSQIHLLHISLPAIFLGPAACGGQLPPTATAQVRVRHQRTLQGHVKAAAINETFLGFGPA